MGFELKVRGSANVCPQPQAPESLRKRGFALDIDKVYDDVDGGTFSIGSIPVEIELGGESVLRYIQLRSIDPLNPVVQVAVTQPSGSAQVFKVSDLVVLHNPTTGTEVTVLEVTGPGRIEVLVAGNST